MRLSRKITGEFIGVFLIGTLVGAMVMWDWAAVVENKLIGIGTEDSTNEAGSLTIPNGGGTNSDAKLSQFMSRTNDPEQMIVRINEKYREDYHLTQEELDRIQPLIKAMARHVAKIRRQFGADIMATLDTDHQKIAEQLTSEHRAAYEKANEEHRKQISKMLLLEQNPPDQGAK